MVAKQQNSNEELLEQQAVEGELMDMEVEAVPPENIPAEDTDPHQQQIELLNRQLQENLDKAIRAQAELDNVRKRTLRDVENAHKYALDKFASELLPVIDSMEMGINAAESTEDQNALREGMELTLKMFRDVLEKFGITEVESEGAKFDPEKHEAVSMQEHEGSASGAVVSVLQKGYLLNGRLVRPAMVIVAK